MVDMNERAYYISDLYGTSPAGHELIGRGNIGLTVRVYGQNAIGFQYTSTTRDSHEVGADRRQTEQIASIVYTFLGGTGDESWLDVPHRAPWKLA